MSNDNTILKIRAKVKVERYADDVTEEDVKNGLAQPIEIIEYEEDL